MSLRTSDRNSRRQPAASPQVEALEERCLLSADPVLEWNGVALDAVKNDSLLGAAAKQAGPDRASRALAIVQAAVFDAVNSIDRSYQPYLIEVNAPAGASITAAAAQAAHDTLAALFPDYRTVLDATLASDLAGVSSATSRDEGALVGRIAAAAILAVRSHDGADVPMNYTPGTQPGQWQPDPLHPNQTPVGPLWGEVTPFTLRSPEQFSVPPPPALTSEAYADAFNQVKTLGGDGVTTPTTRTADKTQIAVFWSYDGSPGVGTPPRMYNQIAEVIARQEHNGVDENARLFALVNLGMADAAIACWDGKYDYNYWRPITGIRDAANDGNPATTADTTWAPMGAMADNGSGSNFTPPFPSYASGHATFGGTLFTLLADYYGTDRVHFTLGSDEFNGVTKDQDGSARPVVTRSYDSFSQAAQENAISRIYMGVHWIFDATAGVRQGGQIGDFVFAHFLRPARDRDHGHEGSHGSAGNHEGNGASHQYPPWLVGRDFDVNGRSERAYDLTSTAGGPALTPVSLGHHRLEVPQDFGLSAGPTLVGLVVKVEASHLSATTNGDPSADLDLALESPSLLK